jgi:hypothetical protein
MHMQRRMYNRFDGYDELKPLLAGTDEEVLGAFGGRPVLIRIPAVATVATPRARLVSCLLHGNEPAGYQAVAGVLRQGARFPFDLWVLIGNVRAATADGLYAHRHLDDQEDFNRVWGDRDAGEPATEMRLCAAEMLAELRSAGLEAAIDVHNNSGRNPYYSVLPRFDPAARRLAALCADTVLLWRLRAGTLMEALAPLCPAVAVECGAPHDADGSAFASSVVDRFLGTDGLGGRADAEPPDDHRLIETVHRVTVRPDVGLSFDGGDGDHVGESDHDGDTPAGGEGPRLVLDAGLDRYNFAALPAGQSLGHVSPGTPMPLVATDVASGRDATDELFRCTADGEVVVASDLAPIMMTTTVAQTRRDCLFYTTRQVGHRTRPA